jgi:purine-binding chemotaxis protein CheW
VDLLEIRRKAKEQKKSEPRTPGLTAGVAAVPLLAPPPMPAALAAQVEFAPRSTPQPPVVLPAAEAVQSVPNQPPVKAAVPIDTEAPRRALGVADAKDDSFLDAGFFQLATEELYRHTYDIDEPEVASHQVLACLLADERYGIDIHSIKEIIKTREITEVPRAPHFILGIITLRGTVIPIFDLRERLGLTSGPLTRDSKIVVVSLKGALYGMVVDAVIDVAGIPETSMESAPSVMVGVEGRFISGIGRADGEMIILLNLTEVLHIEASRE